MTARKIVFNTPVGHQESRGASQKDGIVLQMRWLERRSINSFLVFQDSLHRPVNQSGLLLRVLRSRISSCVIIEIERFCPKCRDIKILYGIKHRCRICVGRRLRHEGRGPATYCLAKCGGGKQRRGECRHQKLLKILQTVVQTSLPGSLFPTRIRSAMMQSAVKSKLNFSWLGNRRGQLGTNSPTLRMP